MNKSAQQELVFRVGVQDGVRISREGAIEIARMIGVAQKVMHQIGDDAEPYMKHVELSTRLSGVDLVALPYDEHNDKHVPVPSTDWPESTTRSGINVGVSLNENDEPVVTFDYDRFRMQALWTLAYFFECRVVGTRWGSYSIVVKVGKTTYQARIPAWWPDNDKAMDQFVAQMARRVGAAEIVITLD